MDPNIWERSHAWAMSTIQSNFFFYQPKKEQFENEKRIFCVSLQLKNRKQKIKLTRIL